MQNEIRNLDFESQVGNEIAQLRERNEMLMNAMGELRANQAASAKAEQRRHLKYEKPKHYNGERDPMLIDNWIFSVQEYCDGMSIKGADAVKQAVSFTDGIAKQFWRNKLKGWDANAEALPAYGDPRASLESYAKFMRERFYPSDYVKRVRDQLDNVRQVSSVKEYVDRFEELLLQIPSEEYHDADMMHKFLRKLKPEIKKLVMVAGPANLGEAYQQAERIDDIVFASNRELRVRSFPPRIVPRPRKFSDAMEVDAVEVDAVAMEKPNGKTYKGYSKSNNFKCFNCGKPGHVSSKCPLPPTAKTLAYRANNSGNGQQRQ
jgi:hypothetical protein